MQPKRRLTQIFSLMLSGVALISILLIGALWINFEADRSELESENIRSNYISAQEDDISLETNRICDYIETQRQTSEVNFLKGLKQRVHEAYSLVSALEGRRALPFSDQERQELLLVSLKNIIWNQGRGHYYVADLRGEELLIAGERQYENLRLTPLASTYDNPAAFKELTDSLTLVREGFYRYNLNGHSQEADPESAQLAYLKLFEPYQWIIGTGEYLGEFERGVQQELLHWASSMPMPDNKYLMILTYDGDILAHPNKAALSTNIFTDDHLPAMRKVAARIIRGAKDRTKDFIRYDLLNSNSDETSERIAYFRALPDWRWVVMTWVNFRDLEAALAEQQAILASNVQSQIYRIVAISISMLLLIMFLSRIISSLATRSFAAFFMFFEQASTDSTAINPGEQPFEEFARLAVAANSMISQRKLAEQLLRESELKFKTIFEVSPQVITISDLEGRLLNANEEYNKFSRLPLPEALGRPMAETFILTPAQQRDFWLELRTSGAVLGRELACMQPDGRQATLLSFGRTIHVEADSFVLAIFTDISDLKAAEEEKLVLQEKLARSKKMEAMGLMAAEVAHDLNNILSGIIGYPQLLLMEPNITDQQKTALNEILETGQKAAAVVSDLLTIARGVASTKESIPINNVAKQYLASPECKQLQELFPGVELAVELADNAGNIIGSPMHLTKIIMNLVSNAFEAMPQGRAGGRILIGAEGVTLAQGGLPGHADLPAGAYAKLTVADNGPGIPPEDLEKIFEPFYSKKVKGRSGTGLGLAIVWNTIQDHGGYLDVRSSPAGTTFTLYFKTTGERAADRTKTLRLEDYRGRGQRVLVVDDVEIQRKLAAKMLSTLGYEPLAVPSGEAAVELLKKEDVDLVILDMIMHPGMNGRETYAAIMDFKPGQKAIIASGMAETEEVALAQALGAGQFVNKPYTIEELAVALQKALA